MEKCFADNGVSCSALMQRKCNGCNFYKPTSMQVGVVIKEIQTYRNFVSKQSLKTLVGQARSGDLEGALKGLDKVKKARGL